MKLYKNYRYKESLPVDERDRYQSWKKDYDRPKSVEDRKQIVRRKNSGIFRQVKSNINNIYQDLLDICERKVKDISYDDIEQTLYVPRIPTRMIDEDYLPLIEFVDDSGSNDDFILAASNFRPINNPSDLFELSPRHTHILLVIGDSLLTNFDSRKFNPDSVIKEIRNNLNLDRTLTSSIYDSLKYIAKNKEYHKLESVGPAYCIIDLGCILDFDYNYDQIRDMVITLFLLVASNSAPLRKQFS